MKKSHNIPLNDNDDLETIHKLLEPIGSKYIPGVHHVCFDRIIGDAILFIFSIKSRVHKLIMIFERHLFVSLVIFTLPKPGIEFISLKNSCHLDIKRCAPCIPVTFRVTYPGLLSSSLPTTSELGGSCDMTAPLRCCILWLCGIQGGSSSSSVMSLPELT